MIAGNSVKEQRKFNIYIIGIPKKREKKGANVYLKIL